MNNFDKIKPLSDEIDALLLDVKDIKPSLYREYTLIIDNAINGFIDLGEEYIKNNPQEFEIFLNKLNDIIKILKFIKSKENIKEMKLSELKQLIKEEILAEAKKDKSGLPFALAANIEKYGKPQTPKGAKPTHFTKKQEKSVKKTAEKLKKYIKEDNTPKHKIVAQWMGPDFFLAKKKETDWDDKDYDLFYRLEKMVTTTGEVPKLNENKDNYMFFQNLKTIKEAVDEMLAMDPDMVDMILSNGHDWANDHIATSKDDTEEVYNFLKTKSAALVSEKLKGGQKKLDANKNGKIDAEDFKLLKAKKK